MSTKVYMEALSPTMEEGRLITWLKNEGDEIAEGDVLSIDFSPEDKHSSLTYLFFVPQPGTAVCLGLLGLAGTRRWRTS